MPLMKAVLCGNLQVVTFLLENGCVPKEDDYLMHMLAESSDYSARIDIAGLLLNHCGTNALNSEGNAPLHVVRDVKFAEFLIENGAAADTLNTAGYLPYETADNEELVQYLKSEYHKLHPVVTVVNTDKLKSSDISPTDWSRRFSTQQVSIQELIPNHYNDGTSKDWTLTYLGEEFKTGSRFITSLAKKMKFSGNIFKYFSPPEVFERVGEKNPDCRFQVTFDHYSKQILGIVDEGKRFLPPAVACKVFEDDTRIRKVSYNNGIWSADLHLDETFKVKNSGDYFRRLHITYPVDGVGMPSIYLSMMRQVCSNGSVAKVAEFRTDIEINDESGLHLSRLLGSFNNRYGFSALEERLGIAQDTAASVRELLEIDSLLMNHIQDKQAYRMLHNRLDEIAGEPCFQYGTTSLNNIPAKKRTLLPVDCSVNDLLNFCSELTTHHGNLLRNAESFDVAAGKILAHEFDLEGMYRRNTHSPDFFLKKLDLPTTSTRESFERRRDTEFIDA